MTCVRTSQSTKFLFSAAVIKEDAGRGLSLNVGLVVETQEAYLGQLRTMGSWCVYLFSTLLCATGLLYSYGHIQTEEYKTRYLTYFTTTEDSNEKQLVSYT